MLCQSALGQVSTWADRVGQGRVRVRSEMEAFVDLNWGPQRGPLAFQVVFNLGRGGVPWGRPVAGQLSGTPPWSGGVDLADGCSLGWVTTLRLSAYHRLP